MDGDDRHRPCRVVWGRIPEPCHWGDALHEAGKLRGQADTEARAPRIAGATDAVHVDTDAPRRVAQYGLGVLHVVWQVRHWLRMPSNIHSSRLGALQCGKGKLHLLCKADQPGDVEEAPSCLVGPRRQDPERARLIMLVARGQEEQVLPRGPVHGELHAVEAGPVPRGRQPAAPALRQVFGHGGLCRGAAARGEQGEHTRPHALAAVTPFRALGALG
mmetsp:Transcript_108254/g.329048  ORF Transcript_108254/g.329048 Transcript_108254/m.329048 type:complete len:217 (-) Transcript_108254:56-706(-)